MGKGAGAGLLTVLDQMQSMAATGTMAPADMPGFTPVAGAVGWTTQLPVPFWDELSESWVEHAISRMPLEIEQESMALLGALGTCFKSPT